MSGMGGNPLIRLADYGQSVWCDDIGRDLLLAGRLKALIDEDGVSGVTSNPTIFHKAITESSSYDEAIRQQALSGSTAAEIVEALTLEDIRLAADQLHPLFVSTSERDGWVSIEVAPEFAYDTERTIAEVMRVYSAVERRNVLIKVPATKQGVEAVRTLTGRGYSINVTLIFSLDRHRAVMEAYLSGLEMLQVRRAAGEAVPALRDVHGVASFFVSRVDTAVDRLLEELVSSGHVSSRGVSLDPASVRSFQGRAAVANAKCAYQSFLEAFSGSRWEALKAEGATVQRPLWASTSTKNPAYSDILYVQELIGPDTVNTMPLSTMDAFRDHGMPAQTVTSGADEAAGHLAELENLGIDLQEVTAQLEEEGVQAFARSFDALVAAVEERRAVAS